MRMMVPDALQSVVRISNLYKWNIQRLVPTLLVDRMQPLFESNAERQPSGDSRWDKISLLVVQVFAIAGVVVL